MFYAEPAAGAFQVLERHVWRGDAGLLVESRGASDLAPSNAFAVARALKQFEDFAGARDLLEQASSTEDAELRARSEAHQAHLEYYAGRFQAGLARARSAQRAESILARAEGHLYGSVNALALNDGAEARASLMRAGHLAQRIRDPELRRDLRFRIARQFVHTAVARGEYLLAASEAAVASRIASKIGSERHRGIAEYLHGYTQAARGDPAAADRFAHAVRHWGGSYRSFGRWVRFTWACCLRDQGHIEAARDLRRASGMTLSWEEPLFQLAEGTQVDEPSITNSPFDELPFRRATRGLVLLAHGRPREAVELLRDAADEFARCELDHYRRGAALMLAAAEIELGELRSAQRRLQNEEAALVRYDLGRWPWWEARIASRIASRQVELGRRSPWERIRRSIGEARASFDEVLRARGLTERETLVVASWRRNPAWSRERLARELGITDASLRNHLNRVRRKLGCGPSRGVGSILERIGSPPIVTARRGLS